jgi:hypothetical protein
MGRDEDDVPGSLSYRLRQLRHTLSQRPEKL